MEGFIDATLALIADPFGLFILVCGLVAGLVSGIIPGLGTMALAVVILPLTVALPLPYTMTMYGVLFISGVAGRWTAGIGGEGQMALAGLRGPAVVHVVLGGAIAAMLAMLLTEGVAGYVFFGFKTPEIFALAFFAIAAVAGVGSHHGPKGCLALFLGLLLGMSVVGPISDAPRYIFGGLDILASITFVPLLVGFLVMPFVIDAASHKSSLTNNPPAGRTTLSAAATNAALLPLVALGLPPSLGTVVMIAAAGLQGVEFGPLFIIEAEEAAWALLAAAMWASLMAPLLGIVTANRLMYLRKIPASIVGAGLLVFATAGIYALDARMQDVYIMFGGGLVGFFLRQQGLSACHYHPGDCAHANWRTRVCQCRESPRWWCPRHRPTAGFGCVDRGRAPFHVRGCALERAVGTDSGGGKDR